MTKGLVCFLLILILLVNAVPVFARSSETVFQQKAPAEIYRIRKGDKISVKFLYHPELNESSLPVRPDGKITLQMIEEVTAEGLTAPELTEVLLKSYREILLNPVITVSIVEFTPSRVFISGQVSKPGSYELRGGQTIFQVLALAGGFTTAAHRKMILHARPMGQHELKVTPIDFTKLLKTGSQMDDLQLEDGDYIFVPDSKLSTFTHIVEAFRIVTPGFQIR